MVPLLSIWAKEMFPKDVVVNKDLMCMVKVKLTRTGERLRKSTWGKE